MGTFTTNAAALVDPSVSYPDQFQTVSVSVGAFTDDTPVLMVAPRDIVVDSVYIVARSAGVVDSELFRLKANNAPLSGDAETVAVSDAVGYAGASTQSPAMVVNKDAAVVRKGRALYLGHTGSFAWATVTITFRTRVS